MLFKAMPAEVMAAWSHATIPDMDFQELSMTGAGPTWSIPHEGDALVRLRPLLFLRSTVTARGRREGEQERRGAA
jgi:hypothetical protein